MEFFLTPASLFLFGGLFLFGAFGALLLSRLVPDGGKIAGTFAHVLGFLGSLAALTTAFAVLVSGQAIAFSLPGTLPFVEFAFRFDALAAYFVILVSLVGMAASIYGIGYQKHFFGGHSLGWFGFLYNIFLLSLVFIPLANQAFFFLFLWEIMSLSSYFLVVFERKEESVQAGFLYFLMTHLGTAFVMLALLLAYGATGSFAFDDWRVASANITPLLQSLIFLFALIGFGTKAGIIPLHIWLPEAHPAAPSHVSALMSGVMVKTALFMLVRFFFDFFPGARMEWGLAFMLLGSLSALLGILYALAERDIKRLLAYSTVENVGIMLMGFGAALVFFGLGAESFALFALAAMLYHMLNHAIFKSLLFLGAGAVVEATGTRNLNAYGGLLKFLPLSGFFFLIGSLAISAFPPLNGFASEWLTLQSLFVGIASPSLLVKATFIITIVSLVMTSGLAAATFVKAFGTSFLGRARTVRAELPHEADQLMLLAMGFLALLTLVLGVGATFMIAALIGMIASIGLTDPLSLRFPFSEFIAAREQFANVLPLETIGMLLLVIFAVAGGAVYFATRKRGIVYGRTWDCGTPLSPRTQISSTGFSRSLVTIFQGILRPTRQTSIEYQDGKMRYFIKYQGIKMGLGDPYRSGIYGPAHNVLLFFARQARRIQSGNVNAYALYMFVTLILLLVWTLYS